MILSKKVISSLIILIVAVIIAAGMRQMKPTAKQRIQERSIASVAVMDIQLGSLNSEILSHGRVMSKQHSQISAEVSGKILYTSEKFATGRFVNKGDLLLRVDKTNYEVAVAQAQSQVLEQQLNVKDKSASYGKNALPTQQAKAALNAAKKQLIKAQRDLSNTAIKAAFNGIILNRQVDVGQFISPGLALFDLSATDMAEVQLPINRQDIEHLDNNLFHKKINTKIHLSSKIGMQGNSIDRTLNSARLQGTIDDQSHVFYLTVDIADPYNFQAQNQQLKPLPLGSFVNARIESRKIENAVRIPLQYIQADNSVYLYVDGVLKRQNITILRTEEQQAVIQQGLQNGDQLVITQLPIMFDGMPVQLQSSIKTEAATQAEQAHVK